MTKQKAEEMLEKINCGFDFHEDTQTLHCHKCGQRVGWVHPCCPEDFIFSSSSEGDEEKGICYDCKVDEL